MREHRPRRRPDGEAAGGSTARTELAFVAVAGPLVVAVIALAGDQAVRRAALAHPGWLVGGVAVWLVGLATLLLIAEKGPCGCTIWRRPTTSLDILRLSSGSLELEPSPRATSRDLPEPEPLVPALLDGQGTLLGGVDEPSIRRLWSPPTRPPTPPRPCLAAAAAAAAVAAAAAASTFLLSPCSPGLLPLPCEACPGQWRWSQVEAAGGGGAGRELDSAIQADKARQQCRHPTGSAAALSMHWQSHLFTS